MKIIKRYTEEMSNEDLRKWATKAQRIIDKFTEAQYFNKYDKHLKIHESGRMFLHIDNLAIYDLGHLPDHLIKAINDENRCVIRWTIEDVEIEAARMGLRMTHAECLSVLKLMYRRHDATNGISWDTINHAIKEVKHETNQEK